MLPDVYEPKLSNAWIDGTMQGPDALAEIFANRLFRLGARIDRLCIRWHTIDLGSHRLERDLHVSLAGLELDFKKGRLWLRWFQCF
jgi:hypothetical protein